MPPRKRLPPRSTSTLLPPLQILFQIVILQITFYALATTLILFAALTAGRPFSPDLVLGWRGVRGDTAAGWTLGLCWMLASFLEVSLLLILIVRSKLIPDFALTLHGLHLVLTWVYSGAVPAHALWWGTQACSAALMVGLGVWACQKRELRPIQFGGGGRGGGGGRKEGRMVGRGEAGNEDEREGNAKVPGDEERGWWGRGRWGRGWGRGRDPGGGRDEYEMVGLREEG